MRPGPALAASLLTRVLTLESPPKAGREWLREIILTEGWASGLGAAELAEKWEARFLGRLRRDRNDLAVLGRSCSYEFNSSSDYMIQGACFIEPSDSEGLKQTKHGRAQTASYASALRTITPDKFEAMCRGVLRAIGVESPALTPSTADEGIDFYGQLKLGTLGNRVVGVPRFEDLLNVWLIGQAKHYPSGQAATPEIRELVGSVELARAAAFSRVSTTYTDLQLRLCDPVFFLFFTTGTISAPGWRLLHASGVVGMDGGMLAAFLADQGIALTDQGVFDSGRFEAWLRRC